MSVLLLLLLALARAAPEDTLDAATLGFYTSAAQAEEAGDLRRAATGYRLVLSRDPSFAPAILGLGRALERAGDTRGAAAVYARLPNDAEAVDALARLVERDDPRQAAELYRRLQTLRLGEPWPYLGEARARLSIDPIAALAVFQTYLSLVDGEPDGTVLVALAVALREAGHAAEATALLEDYQRLHPEGAAVGEARGRLERWRVEEAAQLLAVGGGEPLSEPVREEIEACRGLLARGESAAATTRLRELVRLHPRAAEAWLALGDVHRAAGRVEEAERAYAWATALAPDDATGHAELGLLLARSYGGRRHREAMEALQRALALRPSWAELQYELGRVLQEMGSFEAAAAAYRAFLASSPRGATATDASARLLALTRTVPPPPEVKATAACTGSVPAAVCDQYRVARVYLARDEIAAARQELTEALAAAPRWPAALNLLAAIELRQQNIPAAVRALNRSLEADPEQPGVLLGLGELARREGRADEALALLRRAADAGSGDAWYYLAEIAYDAGEIDEAAAALSACFATGVGGPITEQAYGLQARVDLRLRQRQLVQWGGLALTGLALGGALLWRQSGATLADLLERHPEAGPEVARLLSALRHEVLKHNTTLLGEVARALDLGEHQAVLFASNRLYGGEGQEDGGILARFDRYYQAILGVGRRHGMRLNLHRRDPVLAPMRAGMRRLRALERDLRHPWRARRGLSGQIRALSTLLNETCYRSLGRAIREIGTLRITAPLLASVDAAVRAEPAFSGQALPPLELRVVDGGLPARILRGDLEDITANLLRNAYRAVGEGLAPGERRVGLSMDEDVDLVTGLEDVVLRFQDNAPGPLTDEMIRSRSIGRGLGLVLDMVTRNDGSLAVEREPGWAKAVVIRLPRAEEPGEGDLEESAMVPVVTAGSSPRGPVW